MEKTAKQLAQDLQNQIDLLNSDYNQMIGITDEDYQEQMNFYCIKLNELEELDNQSQLELEEYEDIIANSISQF